MKKLLAIAVALAFSAGPLLACDNHKDGAKSDTKAAKPLAESKSEDKKI